ncbi:LysM peptidoglycan-binding domain-containing protein [Tepidibacter formicigenes]|jgi:LysM repeat protein|uniref:LysM domain-containing protein n=1 Tax=Tepidibacter formicigenes DSM 15518 TaxID=1123349 RepID=A0A1M6TGN1_9FIRM|nr:LysM peptidoglycan-binding domain-containing protein [Tepidibacter formicigenes]SHK56059.1 LysM domain-containing protein [Tepidibacter formicigenes DSM 15518]
MGFIKQSLQADRYTIKAEDTLDSILKKFNISLNEFKKLNNLEFDRVYTRQVVRIL